MPEGGGDGERPVDVILPSSVDVARPRDEHLPLPHAFIVLHHGEELVSELEDAGGNVLGEAQLEPVLRCPVPLAQVEDGRTNPDVSFSLDVRQATELQPQLAMKECLDELVDRERLVCNRSIRNRAVHASAHVAHTLTPSIMRSGGSL